MSKQPSFKSKFGQLYKSSLKKCSPYPNFCPGIPTTLTMNAWKNIVSERAVAPVTNFVRPERLVDSIVAYNPTHFESLLFRAYVKSIANGYAELVVSIPFALRNLDFTEGRIYSLSPFHSNLPSFPIPPTIQLTPSSPITNSININSSLQPPQTISYDLIRRPASARVRPHAIPSPERERVPYHLPRPSLVTHPSPSFPFPVTLPRPPINQCPCSRCMS
jgi:hypothetical protein